MGHRLHSAKKYDIQYSDASAFNWCQEEINEILYCLAEGDMAYDDESLIFSNTLWGNRANLQKNITKIISPNNEWEYQDELNEKLEALCKKYQDITNYSLYRNLKEIIEQSDPNCEDIHFAWF